MNESIRKRISAINSGIIPDGYKKTKVGLVPAEWEECKLSEFLNVNKDKNIDLKYNKEDVFSISGEYGVVNQMQFLGRSYAGESVAPYRIVYPFDIIYTKSPLKINPYGIIKSNQTNATGIVSTLYAVYHCKDNVLSKYIEYYFGLDSVLNNYLLPLVNIGSKHDMKISDENVLKGYVSFPPLPEQQKIAEILTTQDKLIELQERKIEQLKTLKKGYLQKMFPKKGCKYPELRFKGFTEPWEQRKLGDVLTLLKDGTHGTHINVNKGIYLLSAKNIKNGTIIIDDNTDRKISKQEFETIHSNFKLQENDLLLTIVGSIGEVAILKNPDIMTFQRSVAFLRPNDSLLSSFLKTEIDTDFFQKELSDRKSQSAQPGVYLGELEKIPFLYTSLEEQQQIGSYFQNLDNLITLHQRKLDKEKQRKKALMQLLLTGKVRVST